MITKRQIVDTAFRKMGMGRSQTMTGFSGDEVADALQELEDMMAEWEGVNGWYLCYQFAQPVDSEAAVTPRPEEDSMLTRQWLSVVAANLAVRLCTSYETSPSTELASEAYNGTLSLTVTFTEIPDKSSTRTFPGNDIFGSGNLVKK